MRAPSLIAIVGLALSLWGGEYLARDLWEPDEARYAYIAREMRQDGNWAVPHRHGLIYAHKPPLMFWLMNAGATFTGGEITRVSARLPSFLGVVLSLWALSRLALRWADAAAAWRAMAIVCTTYLFWNKGGMAQIDMLLCGIEMTALWQLVAYERDRAWWRAVAAYTAMGLAITAKGPVGVLVPLGMYVAGTFVARDGTPRRHAHYLWGLLLVALPPALWLLAARQNGAPDAYFHELIFKQNLERAAGEYGHTKPFYYYLIHFPSEFMPWTPLWLAILPAYRALSERRPALRRLLAAVAFVIVFFSLSASKRELYILPAYPAAALLIAIAWPALSARGAAFFARYAWSLLAIVAVALSGAGLADLVHPPLIPFTGLALLAPGLAALVGAVVVRRVALRRGAGSDALLLGFATALAAILIAVSTVVYAAVNPMKGPYAVARAADRLLAADDPIYVYRIHAEIMPLYAHRRGRALGSPAEVERTLRAQGHGLVVFDHRALPELPASLTNQVTRERFILGNKTMEWIYWDFRAPAAPAP